MGRPTDPKAQMHKFIGHTLLEERLITEQQLEEALTIQAEAGTKTVETLIRLGCLDPTDFANLVASNAQYIGVEPDHYFLPDEYCDLLPREYAYKYHVFPVGHLGKSVLLAAAAPLTQRDTRTIEQAIQSAVVAVHCNAQTVCNAIQLSYENRRAERRESRRALARRIEMSLKLQNVVHTLSTIESLPTLPQTVERVLRAAHSDYSSAQEIAAIVETDPPIAARLLQLANSPAFGFAHEVETVQHVIALLGVRQTYLAVLSSAVLNIVEASKHFDYKAYWRSASFIANAARSIAERCSLGHKAGIFTAGLLADIGRYTLSRLVPNPYHMIHEGMPHAHLIAAEEDLLGIGHPEAGYILAVHWGLPSDIAQAIRFHHRPLQALEHQDVVAVVALGAVMAEARDHEIEPAYEHFMPYRELLSRLNLDAREAAEVYAETRESESVEAEL
ncbi:MAG: HDOD domain-containing protein [Candidatus Hydrogenedentes bacterium]|nr:HDOD domain-containing protein [Candidatus Hydrogenedentota bacterium]